LGETVAPAIGSSSPTLYAFNLVCAWSPCIAMAPIAMPVTSVSPSVYRGFMTSSHCVLPMTGKRRYHGPRRGHQFSPPGGGAAFFTKLEYLILNHQAAWATRSILSPLRNQDCDPSQSLALLRARRERPRRRAADCGQQFPAVRW